MPEHERPHRIRRWRSPGVGVAVVGLLTLAADAACAQMGPPIVTTVQPGRWAIQPTAAEIVAAKPAGFTARGVVIFRGCNVTAEGRLTDCAVKADPEDPRLRQAAETLLPRYRFSETDAKAILANHGRVDFYIGWLADAGCKPPFCSAGAAAPTPK